VGAGHVVAWEPLFCGPHGQTALHAACEAGAVDIVQLLLQCVPSSQFMHKFVALAVLAACTYVWMRTDLGYQGSTAPAFPRAIGCVMDSLYCMCVGLVDAGINGRSLYPLASTSAPI
jgi:hypothetical protein